MGRVEDNLSYTFCIFLQSMAHPSSVLNVRSKIIAQPNLFWMTSSGVKTPAFDLLNFNSSSSNFLSE